MKRCFRCGKEKEITEFYKHSQMADGHLGKCKECAKADVKTDRSNNIERYRAYDRFRYENHPHRKKNILKYLKTEKGESVLRLSQKRYEKKYPERKWAGCILNRAILKGIIKKGKCEICGSTKKTQGHHDNYYFPLSVKWLCPQCHANYHKKIREEKRLPF